MSDLRKPIPAKKTENVILTMKTKLNEHNIPKENINYEIKCYIELNNCGF